MDLVYSEKNRWPFINFGWHWKQSIFYIYEPVALGASIQGHGRLIAGCLGSGLDSGSSSGFTSRQSTLDSGERLTDQTKCLTHKVDSAVCNTGRARGRSRLTQAKQSKQHAWKMLVHATPACASLLCSQFGCKIKVKMWWLKRWLSKTVHSNTVKQHGCCLPGQKRDFVGITVAKSMVGILPRANLVTGVLKARKLVSLLPSDRDWVMEDERDVILPIRRLPTKDGQPQEADKGREMKALHFHLQKEMRWSWNLGFHPGKFIAHLKTLVM